MGQKFSNAARVGLATTINSTDTTINIVAGGALFPVANTGTTTIGDTLDWFKLVIQDLDHYEIIYVRTHTEGSNTFSNVLRGQEGSSAREFAGGSVIGLRPTAGDAQGTVDALASKQPTLISGENIKTFAGQSLLGSGDMSSGGYQIGDVAVTHRTLSAPEWLPADGSVYLQSEYPELFDVVGLLPAANGKVGWATPPPIDTGIIEGVGLAYFANGEFVTSPGYTLLTSQNGAEWTDLDFDFGRLSTITYAGGYYVVAGQSIEISTNINEWSRSHDDLIRPFPDPSHPRSRYIEHIAYGNGTIVVATTAGDLAVSTDWVNWTVLREYGYMESSEPIRSLTYLNGLFYRLEDWAIFTSSDGFTWDYSDAWYDGEPTSLIYENGLYVGVFQDWGIATSHDGIEWDLQLDHDNYDPVNYEDMGDVLYADGLFISTNTSGRVATSLDGVKWFVRDEPQLVDFEHKLVYGNGVILAIGVGGSIRLGYRKAYDTSTQFITPTTTIPGASTYLKAK